VAAGGLMPILRKITGRPNWRRLELRIPTEAADAFERAFAEVRARFDPALSDAEVGRRVWEAGVVALLSRTQTEETKP
jgi:hypothetical protein